MELYTPPLYLVSACLCGAPCRYDGQAAPMPRLIELLTAGKILPVCPEVLGGLSVPRPPCEIFAGRIKCPDGSDVTLAFQVGAAKTLALAQKHRISLAILKERSPSCGSTIIYDGSFSGKRIPGQGVTAALLQKHGITIFNEHTFEPALFSA